MDGVQKKNPHIRLNPRFVSCVVTVRSLFPPAVTLESSNNHLDQISTNSRHCPGDPLTVASSLLRVELSSEESKENMGSDYTWTM